MTELGRRRFLAGLGGAVAWAAAGCSSGARRGAAGSTSRPLRAPAVPGEDEAFGWIEQVVAAGVRRPGYPADEAATDLALRELRRLGLAVHTEPVAVTRWEPIDWALEVVPPGPGPSFTVDCFPLPYGAPTEGLELDLVAHDPHAPDRSAGRAALVDAPLARLPATAIAGLGSAPDDLTGRIYDPGDTLAQGEHVLPHTTARNRIADQVFESGAAAFIGSLVDHPIDSHRYFVPYHGEALAGPGVWVSGSDGARLHRLLADGPVRVRLTVRSRTRRVTSRTVVGELPGADDELVLVGSHHDGPWASAVEDGSGIAMVLSQATYWSQVPAAERPHRLRFVLHAGHMCGAAGHKAYVAEHADELDRVVLAVHLEHAALDTEVVGGRTVVSDRCVPRWFFTSRLPRLEATVSRAIRRADLRRSLLVAPDALGPNPPTDASQLPGLGVPVVQLLGAPWYLFDEADTLDKVDRRHLPAIGRAVVDVIRSTAGRSAADVRAG